MGVLGYERYFLRSLFDKSFTLKIFKEAFPHHLNMRITSSTFPNKFKLFHLPKSPQTHIKLPKNMQVSRKTNKFSRNNRT